MKKLDYKAQMPKKIVFGDPMYMEEYKGKELAKLIVNLNTNKAKLPKNSICAIRVIEKKDSFKYEGEDIPYTEVIMRIVLSPNNTATTYINEMRYSSQKYSEKEIGVDSASYYISVDNKDDVIHTGGDGYWGAEGIYYRMIQGKKVIDGIVIDITLPSENIEEAEKYLNYFFPSAESADWK